MPLYDKALPSFAALLLIWLLTNILTPLAAQPSGLSFETEQLCFSVQDSLWVFDGRFGFLNDSAMKVEQAIFFPVIQDSLQSHAQDVSVVIGEDERPLPVYQIGPQGFWFQLKMKPKSFETVRIRYRQELRARQGFYVLLSALSWNKPISYASYALRVPPQTRVLHYPFENPVHSTDGDWDIYFWEFYDFVPDLNFEAAWD